MKYILGSSKKLSLYISLRNVNKLLQMIINVFKYEVVMKKDIGLYDDVLDYQIQRCSNENTRIRTI